MLWSTWSHRAHSNDLSCDEIASGSTCFYVRVPTLRILKSLVTTEAGKDVQALLIFKADFYNVPFFAEFDWKTWLNSTNYLVPIARF